MRAVIQLAKFFQDDLQGRGLIREIAEYTGLERHTISALLHNHAKYVSLESIGRLCDYLIHRRGVDPAILPGALFGKQRDGFWSMLADRTRISFSLATRTHPEWPDAEYVMANDSHLQGVLVGQVSALDTATARLLDGAPLASDASPAAVGNATDPSLPHGMSLPASSPTERDERGEGRAGKRLFSDPHHVPAPRRVRDAKKETWTTLTEGQQRAAEIYLHSKRQGFGSAMFTLGSVKVNGVLEVLAGDIFHATPFQSQDDISTARQRACPFYFRYREHDPAPESLCGGTRLSKREAAKQPGIYYETEKGSWTCCPWEADARDVAFVLYAYRPPVDELQLACGGFSGLATRFLAERFVSVASQLWAPQFRSPELEVGLFLVTFDIRKSARGRKRTSNNTEYKHRVIRVPEQVLARRLSV